MIHSMLMPASISSASRSGHHCAPASLPASSSPNTRARSNNLAFVCAPLSGVLWDQLLRASARTASDRGIERGEQQPTRISGEFEP